MITRRGFLGALAGLTAAVATGWRPTSPKPMMWHLRGVSENAPMSTYTFVPGQLVYLKDGMVTPVTTRNVQVLGYAIGDTHA